MVNSSTQAIALGTHFPYSVIPVCHVSDVLETLNQQINDLLDGIVGTTVPASTETLLERAFVQAQVQAFRAHLAMRVNGGHAKSAPQSYIDGVCDALHVALTNSLTSTYSSDYSLAYTREPDKALATLRLAVTTTFAIVYPFVKITE